MDPHTIVVLGKSGSGKDTQVELLSKVLQPSKVISTGDLLRALSVKETLLGKKVDSILEEGGLLPAWLAAFLWQKELSENFLGTEHLLFPSSPRRIDEAKELDDVLSWLGRSLPVAVLIQISDDEAVRRIVKRSRDVNDNEKNVRERLGWFKDEVADTVEYYSSAGRLHPVDGMGTVEDIHVQILDALGIEDTR